MIRERIGYNGHPILPDLDIVFCQALQSENAYLIKVIFHYAFSEILMLKKPESTFKGRATHVTCAPYYLT